MNGLKTVLGFKNLKVSRLYTQVHASLYAWLSKKLKVKCQVQCSEKDLSLVTQGRKKVSLLKSFQSLILRVKYSQAGVKSGQG